VQELKCERRSGSGCKLNLAAVLPRSASQLTTRYPGQEDSTMAATQPPAPHRVRAPQMPNQGWAHMAAVQEEVEQSITSHLDKYKADRPHLSPEALMLDYLISMKEDDELSQLLMAELMYLHFSGDQCPLLYDGELDAWCVFHKRWEQSRGKNTRVKARIQKSFLPAVKKATRLATARRSFPIQNGEDHPKYAFLLLLRGSLSNANKVANIVLEAAMFFDKSSNFDEKLDLFQCSNCVLDLKTHKFRRVKASDMCLRCSPVVIPEEWLKDPMRMDAESAAECKLAWDVVWSLFRRCNCKIGECGDHCEGSFHPNDHADELGDQDTVNCGFLWKALARLLGDGPLALMLFLYSSRGRNGKGLLEKMIMSTWGTYHVSVKVNIFLPDRRNENEHSSADVFRKGARVGFINEVGNIAWSNAAYKNRNSTDPFVVRGCGSGVTERVEQTITFVIGCNDQPEFEQPTKGSEPDRTCILHMPNRYQAEGNSAPTSPRVFPKDLTLEEKVATPTFARGLLLNLIQIRLQAVALGESLDHTLQAGTPTSRFWLNKWVHTWSQPGNVTPSVGAALTGCGEEDAAPLVDLRHLHRCWHDRGTWFLFQAGVAYDASLEFGARRSRWALLTDAIKNSGRLGRSLFSLESRINLRSQSKTKVKSPEPCIRVRRFDLALYTDCFSDASVFGDLTSYTYDGKAEDEDEPEEAQVELQSRIPHVCASVLEVSNLSAVKRRAVAGPPVTGERRQAQLAKYAELLETEGKRVLPGELPGTSGAGLDIVVSILRDYVRHDEHGAAYIKGVGIPNITRESRATALEGFVVGEIDLVAAFLQVLYLKAREFVGEAVAAQAFAPIRSYVENSAVWREAVGRYYEIQISESKGIFSALHSGGGIRPKPGSNSPRRLDTLPCMLELQVAIANAHACVQEHDPAYAAIGRLSKVREAPNPSNSCIAIYLAGEVHTLLARAAADAEAHRLHLLAYVMDSVYVLAESMEALVASYRIIAERMFQKTGAVFALKSKAGDVIERHQGAEEQVTHRAPPASAVGLVVSTAPRGQGGESPRKKARTGRGGGVKPPLVESPQLVAPEVIDLESSQYVIPAGVHGIAPSPDAMRWPAPPPILALLKRMHARGQNCIPWSCLVLRPDLIDVQAFRELSTTAGPRTYKDVEALIDSRVVFVPIAETAVWHTSGLLLQCDGDPSVPGGVGHCVALSVDAESKPTSIWMIRPDAVGDPIVEAVGEFGLVGKNFFQLVDEGRGVAADMDTPLKSMLAGGHADLPRGLEDAVSAETGFWSFAAGNELVCDVLHVDDAWQCPMCIAKEFDTRSSLIAHITARHEASRWGCFPAPQRRIMLAQWSDDEVSRVCRAMHTREDADSPPPRYVGQAASTLRASLSASPSSQTDPGIEATIASTCANKHLAYHIGVVLDNENTRYVPKADCVGLHKLGFNAYCTDRFLTTVFATYLHPDTKGLMQRVLEVMRVKCGAMGHVVPSDKDLLHTLREDLFTHPIIQEAEERCRGEMDLTVLGIDGTYKGAMNILYQVPHGHKCEADCREADEHALLSVACNSGILYIGLYTYEAIIDNLVDALLRAVGGRGTGSTRLVFHDFPQHIDQPLLHERFPNLDAVAADLLHVPLRIEKASNEHPTRLSVNVRRCMHKVRQGLDDGLPYFRAGVEPPSQPSFSRAIGKMGKQRAAQLVARVANDDEYKGIAYPNVKALLDDIAALAKMSPETSGTSKRSKTVLASITDSFSPRNLEYLLNFARFVSRNPDLKVMYGTTPNEAYHKEFAGYCSGIRTPTARCVKGIAQVATTGKLTANLLKVRQFAPAQSQSESMRRYCAALEASPLAFRPLLRVKARRDGKTKKDNASARAKGMRRPHGVRKRPVAAVAEIVGQAVQRSTRRRLVGKQRPVAAVTEIVGQAGQRSTRRRFVGKQRWA
jgi:hypothetical protein